MNTVFIVGVPLIDDIEFVAEFVKTDAEELEEEPYCERADRTRVERRTKLELKCFMVR